MSGDYFAVGGVLINSQYVTHLTKTLLQVGGEWSVTVHMASASMASINLPVNFTTEAEADATMVAIAAGTY